MKKITSLTALFLIAAGGTSLIACGSSAPSKSDGSGASVTSVGSASEAIQKLRKDDADVVASCDDFVKKCESFAGDSGTGAEVCDQLGEHCRELEQQLQEARDAFQQCLEGVAECEASATDPAECRAQRAACNPAGKDFESRRGQTLDCAQRTESCLPRAPIGRGRPAADDGDAGAKSCDADAMDFVGCCHGHGGGGFGEADGGAGRFGGLGAGRGPGAGFPGVPQVPGMGGARMTPKPPVDPRRGQKDDADAQDADDADDSNR